MCARWTVCAGIIDTLAVDERIGERIGERSGERSEAAEATIIEGAGGLGGMGPERERTPETETAEATETRGSETGTGLREMGPEQQGPGRRTKVDESTPVRVRIGR